MKKKRIDAITKKRERKDFFVVTTLIAMGLAMTAWSMLLTMALNSPVG